MATETMGICLYDLTKNTHCFAGGGDGACSGGGGGSRQDNRPGQVNSTQLDMINLASLGSNPGAVGLGNNSEAVRTCCRQGPGDEMSCTPVGAYTTSWHGQHRATAAAATKMPRGDARVAAADSKVLLIVLRVAEEEQPIQKCTVYRLYTVTNVTHREASWQWVLTEGRVQLAS